tara:strand:+ start:48 stop:530 length:483 start_codon:yes stop_codon:yes gene_type:complete
MTIEIKNIKNIVFLKNKKIADFFIKELYPYEANFVILTGDNSYPENKNIRQDVWEKLITEEDISIVVIGQELMDKLKTVKTNKIFLLDRLLISNMLKCKKDEFFIPSWTKYMATNRKLNFTKINFMFLIHCFFNQKYKNPIDVQKFNEYDKDTWIYKLLA